MDREGTRFGASHRMLCCRFEYSPCQMLLRTPPRVWPFFRSIFEYSYEVLLTPSLEVLLTPSLEVEERTTATYGLKPFKHPADFLRFGFQRFSVRAGFRAMIAVVPALTGGPLALMPLPQ